jgi:hypothetical protein
MLAKASNNLRETKESVCKSQDDLRYGVISVKQIPVSRLTESSWETSPRTPAILTGGFRISPPSLQVPTSDHDRFLPNPFQFISSDVIQCPRRSVFWEVIVSVILGKKLYMYMHSIPKGFRDRAISVYCTLQTSNTPCPHTSCKVHWCWRWNFRKCITLGKLYQLCHLNNKHRY